MGCFSWLFADKDNEENLRIGASGYIACPDGTFIKEPCYDGYGEFDGKDIYELVVLWNRKFISENPDHLLPFEHRWNKKDGSVTVKQFTLSSFWWYPVIADLSIPPEKLHEKLMELGQTVPQFMPYMAELRGIGISIACYDVDNASLPYPIKITKTRKIPYADLPPSEWDPEQGLCRYNPKRYS